MIKFVFVGQIPILTERSCSVTLKTLVFKNIQLELLYSFKAKFLTPANTKINSSMFSTLIFIHSLEYGAPLFDREIPIKFMILERNLPLPLSAVFYAYDTMIYR